MPTASRVVAVVGLAALTGAPAARGAEPRRVRLDHPAVAATVALGSGASFDERTRVRLYFKAPDATFTTPVVRPPDPVTGELPSESLAVRRVAPATPDFGKGLHVQRCVWDEGVAVDCRDVPSSARVPQSGLFVEVTVDADWKTGTVFRLKVDPGALAFRDLEQAGTPGVDVVLPLLAEKDLAYVEARPRLRLRASPITREATGEGGPGAAALDFEGGAFHEGGEQRFGVSWAGSVATDARFAFDRVALDASFERNLLAGDFLPLALAARSEADQGFDVVDGSLALELRYVLPVHVNFSPLAEFIPALGPHVRLMGAVGRRLRGTAAEGRDFRRAGYEVRWRVPLAADAELSLHHAGLWDWTGRRQFHPLWDVSVETRVGQLRYFVGYQRGAAPPLFQRTETTRAGLVLRLR